MQSHTKGKWYFEYDEHERLPFQMSTSDGNPAFYSSIEDVIRELEWELTDLQNMIVYLKENYVLRVD